MAVFQRRRPWSLRGGEMRIITLTLLTALACAGPVAEQAAQEPVASSIDAETRAALEKARDVVWRAWFAGDTATLARVIPGALAASEGSGWNDRNRTIADSRE